MDERPAEDVDSLRDVVPVVGSGPKTANDLSYGQARAAIGLILDDEPDPTTLGAFWLANRWKHNEPEELAGFLDAVREHSVRVAEPDADPVDCGVNYDGKADTALLGVASGWSPRRPAPPSWPTAPTGCRRVGA